MNNFDKLNLDTTKYSNLELKEIVGLNDVTDNEQIQKHISNIQLKLSDDTNMSFSDKNRMLTFLNALVIFNFTFIIIVSLSLFLH